MYTLPKIDLNKNREEFSDGDSSQEACYYSNICVCLFAVEDSINLKRDFHYITLQHHLIVDRNYLSLASHPWIPKYFHYACAETCTILRGLGTWNK
jgi:hypothetical protein